MKTSCITTSLLLVCFILLSGFIQPDSKTKDKKKGGYLDDVRLKCLYKYSQKVLVGEEHIIAVDSMMLETGNSHSVYYNWLLEHKDSLFSASLPDVSTIKTINVITDPNAFSSVASGMGSHIAHNEKRETARTYKNRNAKEVTSIEKEESHVGTQYLRSIETISQNWEILPDTLTVCGYICQKAVTQFRGRSYTAWFSFEIPMNDGPWKFYGLPGLILKISDSEGIFDFTAVGIEMASGDGKIIMEGDNFIKSTSKQLENIRQKRLAQSGQWYVEGGNITMLKQDNPLKYYSLELE